MKEAEIRDLLSAQINVLEAGLELLDIEQYIPKTEHRTKCFIDLLGKDSSGKWVIIELKRSDGAARQAIHEIHKYLAGVKNYLGARDDEIRVFIVSTEWRELLTPFSEFVSDTSIEIEGMSIEYDKNTQSFKKKNIVPLNVTIGRVFSPWHELNLYKNKANLNKGIKSYKKICTLKGIDDFILVILKAPIDHHEHCIMATAQSIAGIRGTALNKDLIAEITGKLDRFDYIIYFVPQMLTEERYIDILKNIPFEGNKDISQYDEYKEDYNTLKGDEKLYALHSTVYESNPIVYRDQDEIGNPAKFTNKLIEDEGWEILSIKRYGAFARNSILTDETILSEIGGEDGISGRILKRKVSLKNTAEMKAVKIALKECLANNEVWLTNIIHQLNEAKNDFPDAIVDISVFSPLTGIFTIYWSSYKEDGIRYIPYYSIFIKDSNGALLRSYIGELEGIDKIFRDGIAFAEVLNKYYAGDIGQLTLTTSWSAYEPHDVDILEDLGLYYSTFKCDVKGEKRGFYRYKNSRWKATEPVIPYKSFQDYQKRNRKLITTIVKKLEPRFIGGISIGDSARAILADDIDKVEAKKRNDYLLSVPDECDICSIPFQVEPFMIDGKINGQMAFASMCADCHYFYGEGIGWGKGQVYQKINDENWLLVGGFPPESDIEF